MSDFFDKSPDELLNQKTTSSQEKKAESLDEIMRQIILADMETMKKFARNKKHLNYPQSVEPRWKN